MNKHLISLLVGAAAAGSIFTNVSPAQALNWNVDNVTFLIGNATGSFDYDASANTYTNISITNSPGLYAPITFTNANLYSFSSTTLFVESDTGVAGPSRYRGIRLVFETPLTDFGGVVNLDASGLSYIYSSNTAFNPNPGNRLNVTAGSSISAPGVPFDIPGGAAIPTVGSLFALGVMRQVKKKMMDKKSIANPVPETIR